MRRLIPYFPALVMDFCLGTIMTNTAFFSTSLSLTASFIGTLGAISTLLFSIFAIPFGRLSDRVGRPILLGAGCLLVMAVSLALPQCRNSFHLLTIYPWLGVSQALFWPTYEAWLAERQGEETLIQRLCLFNLFWCSGITLGPLLSSYVQKTPSPNFPFYLVGGLSVLNWWMISYRPKFSQQNLLDTDQQITNSVLQRPIYINRSFLYMSRIANFGSWFTLRILQLITPKLATEQMNILPSQYAKLIAALGIMQLLTYIWYGSKKSIVFHYRLLPLWGPQIAVVIGMFIMGKSYQFSIWFIVFGLLGVSVATTYFSSMYYGLVDGPQIKDKDGNKGEQTGWHEAILGSGALLGPLCGGWLADQTHNPHSPYQLCSGLIFGLLILQLWIWLTMRDSDKTNQST